MKNEKLNFFIDCFLHNEFWLETEDKQDQFFLIDFIYAFEKFFCHEIEVLIETHNLENFVSSLTSTQKEILLKIPENFVYYKTTEVIEIGKKLSGEIALEIKCFERIVKSYKHQALFELLKLIDINKKYALERENHGFGYHFHLYEKSLRTATLLTFDPDEIPRKKGDPNYNKFNHTLYYEEHSIGSTFKSFQDLNVKGAEFKRQIYDTCKNIVITKINKIEFKKQSLSKSKVFVL